MKASDFLAAAEQVVRGAGDMARARLPRAQVIRSKDHQDIVTDADVFVEDYVISLLRKRFPDHGFVSEERAPEKPKVGYVWVLDPIDGTKYYTKDVPLYSVSLALKQGDDELVGVVYSPEMKRMYCAARGEGATLNGSKIRCSSAGRLEDASVCLEIPSRCSPTELRWAMGKMVALVECVQRVRILGVGSLGLCFCAAGGFDAYLNLGSMWEDCDIAAGKVILQEAGGEFCQIGKHIVAGPPVLCSQIRDKLKI